MGIIIKISFLIKRIVPMRFTTALSLTAALAIAQEHTHIDGQEVVQEYEVVTTTTTTEHIDITAGTGCTTNCVFNDFVLILDRISIHEWAQGLKSQYDLLMRDWERSLEHFEFEIRALNEDYWVMFRPLIAARRAIYERRHEEVVQYVINNTYFHGAHIHNVVPEVEALLRNEFNPVANNIVSMFGLGALTLADTSASALGMEAANSEEWIDIQNHTFTFDFEEDEVVAWFQANQAAYDEIGAKYQEDFNIFVSDVNTAVEEYREGFARIEMLYDQIVRNAAADAEFYWQMHFDSPLADVTGVDYANSGLLQ